MFKFFCIKFIDLFFVYFQITMPQIQSSDAQLGMMVVVLKKLRIMSTTFAVIVDDALRTIMTTNGTLKRSVVERFNAPCAQQPPQLNVIYCDTKRPSTRICIGFSKFDKFKKYFFFLIFFSYQ